MSNTDLKVPDGLRERSNARKESTNSPNVSPIQTQDQSSKVDAAVKPLDNALHTRKTFGRTPDGTGTYFRSIFGKLGEDTLS